MVYYDGSPEIIIDEELLIKMMSTQNLNDSFLKILEEVSIECILYESGNCYVCLPNNKKLYSNNIEDDLIIENYYPCPAIKFDMVA